jgi:hypothetical protein
MIEDHKELTTDNRWSNLEKKKQDNRLSDNRRPQRVDNRQPMVEFGKGKMENRPSNDQRWGRQPTTNGQIWKRKNMTTDCATIEDLKRSTTND